jgi:hypothetical protein
MQGLQALDQFKSFVSKIGGLGRFEDTYMVHAAEGETVIPMEVLDRNPILKKRLFKTMMDMGIEPGRYIVGNELNSKNPVTGQPEFFLKYLGRRLRKAAADVSGYAAPIIGAMYGPAAGAAAGAALGQYKRENPGDPNQGMQMALRGGISGLTTNLATGQKGLQFGGGLKGAYGTGNPLEMGKRMLDLDSATYPTDYKGSKGMEAFRNKDDSYKIFDAFRGKDPSKSVMGKQAEAVINSNTSTFTEKLAAEKYLKSSGGFGMGDIFTKGLLPTFALAELIKRGEPEGDDTPLKTNRTINDMIFQNENWADRFAADGGIMDLQDGGESKGPGTGISDSIPAMLSDGEFVMTADAVRGAGGGDRREGAKKMYEAMDQLEARA